MLTLRILLRKLFKRSTPQFLFTTKGINKEGMVELEMEWNRAFLKHLHEQGFIGHNEEECVQMFMMSFTKHPELEVVNTDSHPTLNAETGNMVRR